MKKKIITYSVMFIVFFLVQFFLAMLIGVCKPAFGEYNPLSFKETLDEIPIFIIFSLLAVILYVFVIEKQS